MNYVDDQRSGDCSNSRDVHMLDVERVSLNGTTSSDRVCPTFWQARECTPSPLPSIVIPLKSGRRGGDIVIGKCPQELDTTSAADEKLPMNETLTRRGGVVGFSEAVSVFYIPRRSDYPEDLKRSLFPSKGEMSMNVARNMSEFASEGYDWRRVIEDEAMYIDSTGNRVHPIHLPKIWASREVPSPSVPNLPRPKPQRPPHPSQHRHLGLSFKDGVLVDRPPTPAPNYWWTVS